MCVWVCLQTDDFFSVFFSFYLFYSNRKCVCFECVEYWILVNRTRISLQFEICIILFRFFIYFFYAMAFDQCVCERVCAWILSYVAGAITMDALFSCEIIRIYWRIHTPWLHLNLESRVQRQQANHLFIHCNSRDDDADWVIRVCDLESFNFFSHFSTHRWINSWIFRLKIAHSKFNKSAKWVRRTDVYTLRPLCSQQWYLIA